MTTHAYPVNVLWQIPSHLRSRRFSKTHRTFDEETTLCGREIPGWGRDVRPMLISRNVCKVCEAKYEAFYQAQRAKRLAAR